MNLDAPIEKLQKLKATINADEMIVEEVRDMIDIYIHQIILDLLEAKSEYCYENKK